MLSAGFQPAIPAIEWSETYALDRSATRVGYIYVLVVTYTWRSEELFYTGDWYFNLIKTTIIIIIIIIIKHTQ